MRSKLLIYSLTFFSPSLGNFIPMYAIMPYIAVDKGVDDLEEELSLSSAAITISLVAATQR